VTANTTASVRAFAGRRWLCLISAMVICVCAGFGYAWSVLQTPIIAQFGWADSGVALAYTITVVCSTMAPLLFGGLIRRMSSRLCVAVGAVLFGAGLFAAGLMSQLWQLYLFYGVISGLGVGFIYPSMMAYVVRLFPDRSGMASGLGTAAYGSGAILWAPTAAVLMEKVGLGSAFRVLGVLFAAVILLGSLLLAEPPEGFHAAMAPAASGGQGSGADLNRGQMVRTGAFYRMVAVFTCGLVAGVIVISQASPILQQTLGYAPARAALFVSVFSACNMAGLRPAGPGQHRRGGVPAVHPVHGRPGRDGGGGAGAPLHGGGSLLLRRTGLPPHPPHRPHVRPPLHHRELRRHVRGVRPGQPHRPQPGHHLQDRGRRQLHRRLYDRRGTGRHRPGALPLPESPVPQRRMIWN